MIIEFSWVCSLQKFSIILCEIERYVTELQAANLVSLCLCVIEKMKALISTAIAWPSPSSKSSGPFHLKPASVKARFACCSRYTQNYCKFFPLPLGFVCSQFLTAKFELNFGTFFWSFQLNTKSSLATVILLVILSSFYVISFISYANSKLTHFFVRIYVILYVNSLWWGYLLVFLLIALKKKTLQPTCCLNVYPQVL